jgi:hypothetical protein
MQFHDNKINKKPPQSLYKLNTESDRYRICKYCATEFMVSHRSRKYCDNNNKCSNEFHNALKLYKRDVKKLNDEIEKQQQLEVSEDIIEETNKDTSEEPIETRVEETINETDETILKSNISILESLNLPVKGTNYTVEALDSYGFKFSHFSGRGELFNIDSNKNCHFIQVGNFRLYRVAFSTILIINLIHTLL